MLHAKCVNRDMAQVFTEIIVGPLTLPEVWGVCVDTVCVNGGAKMK